MGLFTRLVMLPFAPVEGVVWVARKLEEQAWNELYGPDSIRAELADLQQALDDGEITEDEYLAWEDVLLDRLDAALIGPEPEVEE
jgi:hypothetical protein